MGDSQIQWTNKTWNPLRAENILTGEVGWFCEHVSPGCGDKTGGGCYADVMNQNTYFGNGLPYKASSLPKLRLFLDEKMLLQPLHWRAPKKIFVCSMTDLFGRFVKQEWIDKMFAAMALATQHTFQVLTKRADRMHDYMLDVTQSVEAANRIRRAINEIPAKLGDRRGALELPLFNVQMSVSCENQEEADRRIPFLLKTPAAVRGVSAEPLLGPIDFNSVGQYRGEPLSALEENVGHVERPALGWVIVGGESGSKSRPMRIDWARDIVRQCQAAKVPVFVKQLGAKPEFEWTETANPGGLKLGPNLGDQIYPVHLKHKKGGDWDEWPEDLRVREFPK